MWFSYTSLIFAKRKHLTSLFARTEKNVLTFCSLFLLLAFQFFALHDIDFVSFWAAWTTSPTYLFKVGKSIQRAPKIRLPLDRVPLVNTFPVSSRVNCPLSENFSVVLTRPAMSRSMLPANLEQSSRSVDPFQPFDFIVVQFLFQPVSKTQFLPSGEFAVIVHVAFLLCFAAAELRQERFLNNKFLGNKFPGDLILHSTGNILPFTS